MFWLLPATPAPACPHLTVLPGRQECTFSPDLLARNFHRQPTPLLNPPVPHDPSRAPTPQGLHPQAPSCSRAGTPHVNTLHLCQWQTMVGPRSGWGCRDGTPAATPRRARGPGREVRREGSSWRERPCGEETEVSSARPGPPGWALGDVVGGQACSSSARTLAKAQRPPYHRDHSEPSPRPPRAASLPRQTELASAGQMGR